MFVDSSLSKDDLLSAASNRRLDRAALRSFYSTAPAVDWALPRKVWTVIGCASVSWGAVFGFAALFQGA
jgi:hypothetical protein